MIAKPFRQQETSERKKIAEIMAREHGYRAKAIH